MSKSFTITFAGDTSLGDYYLKNSKWESINDRLQSEPFSFFEKLHPLIKDSDYLILNLETVLAESPKPLLKHKQYPNADLPDRTLSLLKKLGVSAVSLANNHTMDFGPEVLLDTKKQLETENIMTYGAGSDLKEASAPVTFTLTGDMSSKNVYVLGGLRASRRYREEYQFLADNNKPGVNSTNKNRMVQRINDIRKNDPDALIIVTPHWQGKDYKWASDAENIRESSAYMLEAGADYVIAHGTHMANSFDITDNGLIAYSIGNFVFNSPGRYKKMAAPPFSFVGKLHITETSEGKWDVAPRFYPVVTDNKRTGFQGRPATKRESEKFALTLHKHMVQQDLKHLVNEDKSGCYIELKKDINQTVYDSNDLRRYIFAEGDPAELDLSSSKKIEEQIEQLTSLHKELDAKFKRYYDQLFSSPQMKVRTNKNDRLYEKLSSSVKKDYLSYAGLKQFERRRLQIDKAISYSDIMVEKSEIRRLGYPDYTWKLDKKTNGYKFADSIGFRRPASDKRTHRFSEIEPQTGPVVVKPASSRGSMGVYLIYDEQTIFSARNGKWLSSWQELVQNLEQELAKDKRRSRPYLQKDEWLIEELILGVGNPTEPPSDLKFYCFYGEVVLISETNPSNKAAFCYWDRDGNIVQTGRYDENFYHGNGFTNHDLTLVEQASTEIPSPFVRLDMLKGQDGLYFGEATPRSGHFQLFNEEYNRKMGEALRKAEARIVKDLLHGKSFEAFKTNFRV
ncbi:MAG: hypothetical protein EA344_02025 [Alkalicoccus sp.]|nr:MAG: hypothetical protein EA344_02025 [Alkalicoccus sp.]